MKLNLIILALLICTQTNSFAMGSKPANTTNTNYKFQPRVGRYQNIKTLVTSPRIEVTAKAMNGMAIPKMEVTAMAMNGYSNDSSVSLTHHNGESINVHFAQENYTRASLFFKIEGRQVINASSIIVLAPNGEIVSSPYGSYCINQSHLNLSYALDRCETSIDLAVDENNVYFTIPQEGSYKVKVSFPNGKYLLHFFKLKK